ncbi:unnamed protein product [Schistosoma mattheei]|uniref:Uncharacterized protein n=1 Tax=Schistosoma mattheei TaxID=31246 RepID=A0A183PAW0_9TREM|nr:unnamed protein product [Schistosoma mattheei]
MPMQNTTSQNINLDKIMKRVSLKTFPLTSILRNHGTVDQPTRVKREWRDESANVELTPHGPVRGVRLSSARRLSLTLMRIDVRSIFNDPTAG